MEDILHFMPQISPLWVVSGVTENGLKATMSFISAPFKLPAHGHSEA